MNNGLRVNLAAPAIPACVLTLQHLSRRWVSPVGLLAFVVCGMLNVPATASGAWAPEAVFETVSTPEPGRLNSYLKGDIGVVRRDYSLLYLWAAQRALRGRPLDANEIARARSVQLAVQSEIGGSEDGFSYWHRVREAYARSTNTPMPPEIEVFGTLTDSEADASFLNCQDDAFYTAGKRFEQIRAQVDMPVDVSSAAAVADRAAAQGWLLDWVRGQDAVFSNCAIIGGSLPAPAPAAAAEWLMADRAYQQAAALFYRGETGPAAEAFAAIGRDAASQWSAISAYLVARTWMREALYFAGSEDARVRALQRAAEAIALGRGDARLRSRHEALGRLQRRVALLQQPQVAFLAAMERLDTGSADDDFVQDLEEIRFLLDDVPPEVAAQSWLVNVKDDSASAFATALARWRAVGTLDWLLAVLMHAPVQDAGTDEALRAVAAVADDVNEARPGMLALQYERARLLVARGDASAVAVLDRLLARADLAISDRNALRQLRFAASPSLSEALSFASGQIIGIAYESERDIWPAWARIPEADASIPTAIKAKAAEEPSSDADDTREWEAESWPLLQALRVQPGLLSAAAALMDGALPAGALVQAAAFDGSGLPDYLRRELIGVGWVRAWLLRQPQLLAEANPVFLRFYPEQNDVLGAGAGVLPLEGAPVSDTAFAAALAILRLPGLSPHVHGGIGRALPPATIGQLALWRWWFDGSEEFSTDSQLVRPAFVNDDMSAAAAAERQTLSTIANSTQLLGRVVKGYVQTHPNARNVPEALHLLVRATRYGTSDSEMSKWAFNVLHKRFPASDWAKRTPYFY